MLTSSSLYAMMQALSIYLLKLRDNKPYLQHLNTWQAEQWFLFLHPDQQWSVSNVCYSPVTSVIGKISNKNRGTVDVTSKLSACDNDKQNKILNTCTEIEAVFLLLARSL